MEHHRKKRKTISVDLAEFLNKLFINGHLAEKGFFVFSFMLLGFSSGFFMGRYTQEPIIIERTIASVQPAIVDTKPKNIEAELAKIDQSVAVAAATIAPIQAPAVAAVAEDTANFFFTIRIGSAQTRNQAETQFKKYKPTCGDIDYDYSPDMKKFLIYCGRFDTRASAERITKKLATATKMIVQKYND